MPDSMASKDLNPVHVSKGEITAEDYVIAVMGPTGAGKSAFIATATGRDFGVGHSLESHTSQVIAVRVKRGEDSVVLIDTPGFNGTYLSDYDILKIIFKWLLEESGSSQKSLKHILKIISRWLLGESGSSQKSFNLCGILYLHRISDKHMGSTLIKNLELFQKLIGKDRLDRVLPTTTMWPDDPVDLQEAVEREKELCDGYWKFMIEKGSRPVRFKDTQDAAWSILDSFVKREKLSIRTRTTDQKTKGGPCLSQHLNPVRIIREEIAAEDYVIAVMGPTGAGKSTFIAAATGRDFGVGHGLESHTSQVIAVRVKRGKDSVVLIDTPGFDDTRLSDYDILKIILKCLLGESGSSRKSLKLCGILYLHPISDNRMGGTPIKNLEMFQKLFGKDRLDRVLLTTTMWPDDPSDLQEAVEREKELFDDYWKFMIERGSLAVQFDGTQDSAWSILDGLVKKAKVSIRIQRELNKRWKDVPDIAAGEQLQGIIGTVIEQQNNTLRSLLEEMGKATEQEMKDVLEKEWLSLQEAQEEAPRDDQRLDSWFGWRFIKHFMAKVGYSVSQFPYEDRCYDLISDILKNGEQYDKISHLSGDNAVKMYEFLALMLHKKPKDEYFESLRGDLSHTVSSDGKQPALPGKSPSTSQARVRFAEVYQILLDIIRND